MKKVLIVDAGRTAVGTYGGTLKGLPAHELASRILKTMLERTGISGDVLSEVILGNVLGAGQGMGPARQASVNAGIPVEVPAWSVNMLCGSAMKACMLGADAVRNDSSAVVAAGGMENMSRAPFLLPPDKRFGMGLGHTELLDHMIEDGLTDIFNHYHMGITAENIAERYGISREEQDAFALESQLRTAQAMDAGRFTEEIIPLEIAGRKEVVIFDRDEHPRSGSTMEGLQRLKPAFRKDGTVTAGNASGINDGAAVLLLAGDNAVQNLGLQPIAEIVASAQAGVDPAYMGLGPVPAIGKVLKAAGLTLQDMGLIELNEAFAAQSLGVIRELAAAHGENAASILQRTNVNGGAIALGHPIGASGSRILVTLISEMRRRGTVYGLASLCIGGGMGTAMIVKLI